MAALQRFDVVVGGASLRIGSHAPLDPGLWDALIWARWADEAGYAEIASAELHRLADWLRTPFPEEIAAAATGHGLTALPDGELAERRALSLRPGDERLDWFLIRAATRQEAKAETSLIDAGFAVYLPRAVRWRRSGPLKRRVSYGLFGGYIFVGLGRNQCIGDATDIEGVHGAVRFSADTPPRPLNFAMIRAIAEQEIAGDYDRTRRGPRKDPDRGERVEIIAGQFKGFRAEFVTRRPDERVEVLLSMFGKLTLKADQVGGMGDAE